jgi:tetratricopeptide (TPR) repeat protein
MRPHAFIAMPFGTKPGPDGTPIDFNRIYTELIQPALKLAACECFRADQELRAGDIRADMFQELLIADLVIADLTIDNPNVWYELGVRHALRARGVVLIQGPRNANPFDIYTDRKLVYALRPDGTLDPDLLDANRKTLAEMVMATLDTPTRRRVSPVYSLLPHLEQPQWQKLMLNEANEFSEAHAAWVRLMENARQKNRPGDILQLAAETPTRALRTEALRTAGTALLKLRHHEFALEQFEDALTIDPDDPLSREMKAVCLGLLGRVEETQTWVAMLTQAQPDDPDVWALAGRVATEMWIHRWHPAPPALEPDEHDPPAAEPLLDSAVLRAAAADEDASLERAIEHYLTAFIADARHFNSGVCALNLMLLRQHLGGPVDAGALHGLTGGVHWACRSAIQRRRKTDPPNYALMACRAELALLLEPLAEVRRHFKAALATAGRDWFALDTTRQMLVLLRDLGWRPEETAAALGLVDKEQALLCAPVRPRQVFLFSGHMMDAPDRPNPRFPPSMEAAAAERIAAALDAQEAGPQDLALCQAAAGGDLIFLEACLARGMHIQILLPFDEADFVSNSVNPSAAPLGSEDWPMRYYAMQAQLRSPPRTMTAELGQLPRGADPYERCNLWLLSTALSWGVKKLRFITLWNGGGSDGLGGTAHMLREVKRRTGRVTWIDTRKL